MTSIKKNIRTIDDSLGVMMENEIIRIDKKILNLKSERFDIELKLARWKIRQREKNLINNYEK